MIDTADQIIAEMNGVFFHPLFTGDLGGGQGMGDTFGIGADQAACAQLDPTEIADRYGDDILHIISIKTFQHRNASGAGWLAIIVAAFDFVVLTDDEGVAVVGRVRMKMPDLIQECFGICFVLGAMQISDESAFFDL